MKKDSSFRFPTTRQSINSKHDVVAYLKRYCLMVNLVDERVQWNNHSMQQAQNENVNDDGHCREERHARVASANICGTHSWIKFVRRGTSKSFLRTTSTDVIWIKYLGKRHHYLGMLTLYLYPQTKIIHYESGGMNFWDKTDQQSSFFELLKRPWLMHFANARY